MRIIHFGHSCVLLETASARLLIDPGGYSHGFEVARELDGILITHQHADHIDPERLPILLSENPRAALVVDEGTAEMVAKVGLSATVLRPGDSLELGGAVVDVVGGTHAQVHQDIPLIQNNGYVVDHGAFYHPGDSLVVPEQAVDVLGVPTGAPWLKIAESVEFLRAVAPRVGVPIHEAGLAHLELPYGVLDRLRPDGTAVTVLPRGELAEV